ncbi:glycosyltransferase family 2 protein [Paraprevotella clara]|uniref:Glycosyltransferase, group 2 family protein n=1 Tax=Paraprevotella clara YIT 11840 TaxID=762968 RepID=G5SVW6_9BACT|nr:glycosyltransferase family 2 protein [Paraprevotella clara]EHG98431.1 glycosyltransferase, group 2 family protein [Paraprevotella clara YIT 11840]
MNNPKISIIIPTYNVADFLLQCLNSVAKQTYKNIEVIVIIDGATDGSFKIAKDFCRNDDRFSVYWQDNAGSGPARNNGLDRATGEYIMFVDPDDWCQKDYVENMLRLQQQENYDLVTVSETTIYFNKHGKIKKVRPPHFHGMRFYGKQQVHDNYLTLFEEGAIQAPHCRIYKANIIKKNNVRFPDLRRSQDIVFNYRYYNFAESVLVTNNSGYMYRVLSKERAKRIKPDYYKTIKLIYNDLNLLHEEWHSTFDKNIVCTILYGMVYPLFESNIMRGNDIKYIAMDTTIREILENSRPTKQHLSMVRKFVLQGHYGLATIIIKMVFFLKMIIQ